MGEIGITCYISILLDEQFERSLVDPCVFTRIKDESKVTIIVWVDDTIVAAYGIADTCSPRHGKACFAIRSGYNALWFVKFQKSDVLEGNGFCDSDWGASEDRRSITG